MSRTSNTYDSSNALNPVRGLVRVYFIPLLFSLHFDIVAEQVKMINI